MEARLDLVFCVKLSLACVHASVMLVYASFTCILYNILLLYIYSGTANRSFCNTLFVKICNIHEAGLFDVWIIVFLGCIQNISYRFW